MSEATATKEQWCVVRGCVALADSPAVPYLCRIHGGMSKRERDEWSDQHSWQWPVKWKSILTRIEFQRKDGSVYGYDDDGQKYEGTWGRHWYRRSDDVAQIGTGSTE